MKIFSCFRVPVFTKAALVIFFMFTPGAQAQTISPYLYGQNHWLADGDEGRVGYLQNLWPQVAESGVKIIRIGGNGYEKEFPDRNRLNKMIDNIKGIGAEPLLQVPRQMSDAQAQELVAYYSKKGLHQVKFWSIGNEPLLHKEYTIEQVHEYLVRLAKVMRATAPDIKIFAYDEAWLMVPEYSLLIGGRLDITGLKLNGRWLIDGITFHSYPNGPSFNRDDVIFTGPKKIVDQIQPLIDLIKKANEKFHRKGEHALLWGLTEFNVTYKNPNREVSGNGNPSFIGGQFAAEIYGYGMQFNAFMVNLWCISETDSVDTDFGYLGLPREFYPRSSYYHMQMMSQHLLGRYIKSSTNKKYVKTIATLSDKTIAVMVMNQEEENDVDLSIAFNDANPTLSGSLQITVDANISTTFSSSIAAQSTKVFVFDRNGKLLKTISYGLQDNLYNKPPVMTINQ